MSASGTELSEESHRRELDWRGTGDTTSLPKHKQRRVPLQRSSAAFASRLRRPRVAPRTPLGAGHGGAAKQVVVVGPASAQIAYTIPHHSLLRSA